LSEPGERAGALAGPLFGSIASDRLRERIGSAFEELWQAAIADCAEAETASGHADRAIGRLVDIAAAPPVRENLVGLLMSAYAAAGRKAEALATYRQARQWLIDELGLEPSDALRA
jgi:DNA-binding SARP family transcriptional activator